jgi:hypothetical protein
VRAKTVQRGPAQRRPQNLLREFRARLAKTGAETESEPETDTEPESGFETETDTAGEPGPEPGATLSSREILGTHESGHEYHHDR